MSDSERLAQNIARNNCRRWIRATVEHVGEIKQDQYIRFQSTRPLAKFQSGNIPPLATLRHPSFLLFPHVIRRSVASIMHRCLWRAGGCWCTRELSNVCHHKSVVARAYREGGCGRVHAVVAAAATGLRPRPAGINQRLSICGWNLST